MSNNTTENPITKKENTNFKKNRKKPKFKFNKNKKSALKSEEEAIKALQGAHESIDPSKIVYFRDFPLSQKTLRGLKENGFIKPTEIQRDSIGLSLRGLDILGAAKTGSGKTLAFLIPVLELLYCKQWTRLDGVGALIITPTRELAFQIFETLRKIGLYHDVSAGLIIGGKDLHFERKRMDQCNVVICTPGRLLQHMDENPLFDCSNMQILILDEADRCLDLGFEATMNSIIENLPPKRQTLLFSATQTKSVRDLARLSLKDPMYVSVHEHAKHSTPESLRQSYVVCELHQKLSVLWSFMKSHLKQKILVFMSSCKQVKYFYEIFCKLRPGTTLLALYGTLHQLRRMAIYESFCRKSNAVLFATDIAARGLDFPEVNWVVQLDCPEDANTYIHRAGRTARYQKGGESLLVLLPSEEAAMKEELDDKKIPISKIKVNPAKLMNPQVKIEAFLAKDPNLKESAQRAIVSYMKSVFLMKNKQIFDINALDTVSFSRSLGLALPPRIRFLQRFQKKEGMKALSQNTKNDESETAHEQSSSNSEEDPEHKQESRLDLKASVRNEAYNFGNDDSDSEDDILKVKRKNHDLEETELPILSTDTSNFSKTKKPITKAALAKKILKKKIVPNKKTVFNEEGQAVLDVARDKVSDLAREYESELRDGIDIEEAKKIMREEDKYDKQRFREKIKAEHRLKKLKLKNEKKKKRNLDEEEEPEEEQMEEEDQASISAESDEESLPDLSWLPDPDKVYPSKENDESSSEMNSADSSDKSEEEEENQTNIHKNFKTSKRKKSQESKQRKRPRHHESEDEDGDSDQPLDTGLSLQEDEELALHILRNER